MEFINARLNNITRQRVTITYHNFFTHVLVSLTHSFKHFNLEYCKYASFGNCFRKMMQGDAVNEERDEIN